MTPQRFKAWMAHMGFTNRPAAEALGVSTGTIELYRLGYRREDGRPVVIPKAIELACAAIALGIKEYEGPPNRTDFGRGLNRARPSNHRNGIG